MKPFDLDSYQPIDYRNWKLGEAARRGENIAHLLTDEEKSIWDAAQPFQDPRGDPGHGEFVTLSAIRLLEYLPGERSIVVPTAIMHDIGWYGKDPEQWKKQVHKGKTDGEASRRPHQNRGLILAGRILERIGYNPEHNFAIADIIGDHDTRNLPPTPEYEARVVWDADMLWRVSLPQVENYFADREAVEVLSQLERVTFKPAPHDLSPAAEQIARVELANTMMFKFPQAAADLMRDRYRVEVEKIERMIWFYRN